MAVTLHSLPIFVRLRGRPVILVGEGEATDAKRRLLERAGATVVGEEAEAALAIVVDADAAVARLKARGVLVNAVDRPELCDFTLPAIVDRAPVIVAVGTGGASAGLAAALRQRLEALLPAGLGRLAEALDGARGALRERWPEAGERRRGIAAMLAEDGPADLMRCDLHSLFAPGLSQALSPDMKSPSADAGRTVIINLISPDPDDLTLRQARALANADRVTHRPDVPRAILDRARADAVRVVCATSPEEGAPGLTVDLAIAR